MFKEINHMLVNLDNVLAIEIRESENAEEIENGYPYRIVALSKIRYVVIELGKGSKQDCEEIMKQITIEVLGGNRKLSFPVAGEHSFEEKTFPEFRRANEQA